MHEHGRRMWPRYVAEILCNPFVIEDAALEIAPNPRVIGAAIAPADSGAVVIDGTTLTVLVDAAAIRLLADVVRLAQVPAHMAVFDFRDAESEIETAAHGFADRQAAFAVDHRVLGLILDGFDANQGTWAKLFAALAQFFVHPLHGQGKLVAIYGALGDQQIGQTMNYRL